MEKMGFSVFYHMTMYWYGLFQAFWKAQGTKVHIRYLRGKILSRHLKTWLWAVWKWCTGGCKDLCRQDCHHLALKWQHSLIDIYSWEGTWNQRLVHFEIENCLCRQIVLLCFQFIYVSIFFCNHPDRKLYYSPEWDDISLMMQFTTDSLLSVHWF